MKQSILLIILRILLAAIFIFSALSKLFPIEVFELNFVYHGIANWDVAPYLSRSLITLELFLGVSLLFNNLLKQIILPITFLLLLFFTIYLFYSIAVDGNSGNCGCFGTILPMTPLESIIKNIVLMCIAAFIYLKSATIPWKYKWLLPAIFVASSTSIILLFPIYEYPDTVAKTNASDMANFVTINGFKGDEKANLKEGKKLVAFFNMQCSHCQQAAVKLSAISKRIKMPPMYYVLFSEESEVAQFYNDTKSSAPYVIMNPGNFIRDYKSGWPRVCLLENGIIKYDWDYRSSFKPQELELSVSAFMNELENKK